MSRKLRILLCCQQDLVAHPIPAYRFWAQYFRSALAEAEITCLEVPGCDWAAGLEMQSKESLSSWRSATWNCATDWIRREHAREPISLFLSYLYPEQIDTAALSQIRDLGIPLANFFCDNIRLFTKAPKQYGVFDLNWVPEAAATTMYQDAGLPYLHAAMPCWVAKEWRTIPTDETLPPTFIGTRDDQRERLFAEAFRKGLTMELRGVGWTGERPPVEGPPPGKGLSFISNQWAYAKRHGVAALAQKVRQKLLPAARPDFDFSERSKPPCSGDDYVRCLRDSKVCVGVNRVANPRRSPERPDFYSRLRDIEGPMVGAAYLTEYAPGLEALYDIGREIEVYRGADELISKISELLGEPARRRSLRELGQKRALGHHGIAQTVGRICAQLGAS